MSVTDPTTARAAAVAGFFSVVVAGGALHDAATSFTCSEAEAIAELLRSFGHLDAADSFIESHADGDEHGDMHCTECGDGACRDEMYDDHVTAYHAARAYPAAEYTTDQERAADLDAAEPTAAAPLLWIDYRDASGFAGSARWGDLTDAQIDAALAAAVATLGEPHTQT